MLPPLFTYSSHCKPQEVSHEYSYAITCATPLQPTRIRSVQSSKMYSQSPPVRLSSTGHFLFGTSTVTSSLHCLLFSNEILPYTLLFVKTLFLFLFSFLAFFHFIIYNEYSKAILLVRGGLCQHKSMKKQSN